MFNMGNGAETERVESNGETRKFKYGGKLKAAILGLAILLSGDKKVLDNETWEEMRDRAEQEMAHDGITKEQRHGHFTGLSELIYKNITPANYALNWGEIADSIARDLENGRKELRPGREDAWCLYLGIPQKNGTFEVSNYKPQLSHQNIYYYRIKDYFDKYDQDDIKKILGDIDFREKYHNTQRHTPNLDIQAGIMGEFSWSKGSDSHGPYIAYYDKWDLSNPVEKLGLVGKQFEIYDRLYYDEKTFKPILHK